jgi:hypothetical protein
MARLYAFLSKIKHLSVLSQTSDKNENKIIDGGFVLKIWVIAITYFIYILNIY